MTTVLPAPPPPVALRTNEPYASPFMIELFADSWSVIRVSSCALCGQPCDGWECVQCATAADADYTRALDR